MKTVRRDDSKDASLFVEWPDGLFTARGNWYHVTSESLSAFASGVLERVPLTRLLKDADTWVASPRTLTLWVTLVTLWFGSPLQAAALGATVFLAVSVVGPGLATLAGVRVARLLEPVWAQGIGFLVILSLLAAIGNLPAVFVGLAAFVLVRWGVLAWVFGPLVAWMRDRLDPLPVPDRILRTLIVRRALALGVSLPEIDRMEARMLDLVHKRPGKKRKT